MLPALQKAQKEHEDAQFMVEMHRDKVQCLDDALVQLKKEAHTLK